MAAEESATVSTPSPKENMESPSIPCGAVKSTETAQQPRPLRPPRPNYHKIHARPMPLSVYPLPFYAPHNPIHLIQVAYVIVKDYFFPRQSHEVTPYRGLFSTETRSVHVTDPTTVRALWEMGFFGKGSLSRSEPTWLVSEKRRLGLVAEETSQEVTQRRRKEREQFKRERARLEREALEAQIRKELKGSKPKSGTLVASSVEKGVSTAIRFDSPMVAEANSEQIKSETKKDKEVSTEAQNWETGDYSPSLNHTEERAGASDTSDTQLLNEDAPEVKAQISEPVNQEHLQLSLEEAFYLSYSLGALEVLDFPSNKAIRDQAALLQLYRCHSYFPPAKPSELKPDDQFLLNYVVYHHFRSLGWVVRDGIKFGVDYLLYQRGPAFTHATFAIMVIPSHTHSYWYETPERAQAVEKKMAKYKWHWLHCINRVQGQVVKTLVLVYVDVPPPMMDERSGDDIGKLLRRYKVREFCVQRWNPNRNRD